MSLDTRALDRRKVLAGAAWAAPVLAVAVAAPAAAASTLTVQPAPPGTLFDPIGFGVTVASNEKTATLAPAAGASFNAYSGATKLPEKTRYSGTVKLVVTWTASSQVTATLPALNGWTKSEATSGDKTTATYTYAGIPGQGILNGTPAISLPSMSWAGKGSSGKIPSMTITASLSADFVAAPVFTYSR